MFRRKRVLDGMVRRKFLITLKSSAVMSGLLVESDDAVLVFAHIKVQQPDGSWEAAADGHTLLFRPDIESLQRVSVIDAA